VLIVNHPNDRAAWEGRIPPSQRDHPALAYVEEDPALPRGLLLGDSISIGYTLGVRTRLRGQANVIRPYQNCIGTDFSLGKINEWLGDKPWSLVYFIKRTQP